MQRLSPVGWRTERRLSILVCAVAILARLFLAAPLIAQISPGKLSKYHEELEGIRNCTACHKIGEAVVNDNCLVCHTSIGTRLESESGYHASRDVRGKACASCHSEHHGRDFEPIYWSEGITEFDHSLTGYPLEAKHRELECRDCHKAAFHQPARIGTDKTVNPSRTFLGLDKTCTSCHVDEHRDQLTDDCLSCHIMAGWKPASGFDHNNARYRLDGQHTNVTCEKCHTFLEMPEQASDLIGKKENKGKVARYQGLQFSGCASCHSDVHKGRFGTDCSKCHTTAGFKHIIGEQFDHDNTAYPLRGRHRQVECRSCHRSGVMTDPLAHDRCLACHLDEHRGQFASRTDGGACESCHTVEGFIPAGYGFEQHQQSDFPLTGSHFAVPCNMCHARSLQDKRGEYARFSFGTTTCQTCHEDIHEGQLNIWVERGGCEYCHNTETWRRTSFDHGLARFPLEGKHREILCLECHSVEREGERVVWMKPLEMSCAGCHKNPHGEQFVRAEAGEGETACDRCHQPGGWGDLLFAHNRDSRFQLDGAHLKVACGECHKAAIDQDGTERVIYRPLGMECSDCHGSQVPRIDTDGSRG